MKKRKKIETRKPPKPPLEMMPFIFSSKKLLRMLTKGSRKTHS